MELHVIVFFFFYKLSDIHFVDMFSLIKLMETITIGGDTVVK